MLSFCQAALRHSKRAASIRVAISASLNWIAWCCAMAVPKALRVLAYFKRKFVSAGGYAQRLRSNAYAPAGQGFHGKRKSKTFCRLPCFPSAPPHHQTYGAGIAGTNAHLVFFGSHCYAWPVFFYNKGADAVRILSPASVCAITR